MAVNRTHFPSLDGLRHLFATFSRERLVSTTDPSFFFAMVADSPTASLTAFSPLVVSASILLVGSPRCLALSLVCQDQAEVERAGNNLAAEGKRIDDSIPRFDE